MERAFMAKRKGLTLKKARVAAGSGDVDRALPALLDYAEAGDVTAAASAAELLAYLGRWSEVIPLAGAFAANPFATYAGNVSDDMVRLLGRAAIETGDWARVARLAREARAEVNRALDRNPLNFPQVKVDWVRARETKILDHLGAAADRQDAAACAEPIYIFGGRPPKVGRREAYESAIAMEINRSPMPSSVFTRSRACAKLSRDSSTPVARSSISRPSSLQFCPISPEAASILPVSA